MIQGYLERGYLERTQSLATCSLTFSTHRTCLLSMHRLANLVQRGPRPLSDPQGTNAPQGTARAGSIPESGGAFAEPSFGGAAVPPGGGAVVAGASNAFPWAQGFAPQWQDGGGEPLNSDPRNLRGSVSRSTSPTPYGFHSGNSQVLQVEHEPYMPSPGVGLGRRFWSPPADGTWSPNRWHRPMTAFSQGRGSGLVTPGGRGLIHMFLLHI